MPDDALTVTQAVARFVQERAARHEIEPLTARTLRHNLTLFARIIDDPPLAALTSEHVERWLEAAKIAPSTRRTRLSQIRVFARWALERRLIAHDPMSGVRLPRQPRLVPRALKPVDVAAVLAVCAHERERLIVLLMVQEGLRRKEVAGLQLGDVDLDDGVVFVKGKGNHERVLPMSAETTGSLTRYLAESPIVAGPLLRSKTDARSALAPVTVGRLVSDLMRDAGVKQRAYDGKSAHALRHSAATHMLKHGAHVRDVQAALGHANLATTERYLAWEVRGLRDAMGGRRYASAG